MTGDPHLSWCEQLDASSRPTINYALWLSEIKGYLVVARFVLKRSFQCGNRFMKGEPRYRWVSARKGFQLLSCQTSRIVNEFVFGLGKFDVRGGAIKADSFLLIQQIWKCDARTRTSFLANLRMLLFLGVFPLSVHSILRGACNSALPFNFLNLAPSSC